MDFDSRQGAYFLANDVVIPWAVAFLESFRKYNPTLRLILLPFDSRYQQLASLAEKYHFEIFNSPHFAALDIIGSKLDSGYSPFGRYWFRRFASFWGPLDNYLYTDCRLLVLSDVTNILKIRQETGYDLLYSDSAIDQVYNPGPLRSRLLWENKAQGFLSGLWVSRQNLFSLHQMEEIAEYAVHVRDQLNYRNSDQFFLNLCCDLKKIKYASFADIMPGTAKCAWARQKGIYSVADKYYIWDHGGLEHNKRILMLHWAGYKLSPAIPYSNLFIKYHTKSMTSVKRFLIKALWTIQSPIWHMLSKLHRNRHINTMYHQIRRIKRSPGWLKHR